MGMRRIANGLLCKRPNVETMGFYFYFSNSTEIVKTCQAVWDAAYTNF